MSQSDQPSGHRYKHIFLDAEGTLYVPKRGRSRWDFWDNPTPGEALGFFELDRGVPEALIRLRRAVDTLCIVSMNSESVLNALLATFKIGHFFDAIMLNGNKGRLIERYLKENGFRREEALMVGDMPALDIFPARAVGIEAILVDRSYNRSVVAERISGVGDLPAWLRIAEMVERDGNRRPRLATLDEYFDSDSGLSSGCLSRQTKSLIADART